MRKFSHVMVTRELCAVLSYPRISFQKSSRDGHAVFTCIIITLFHLSYKIFVYKTKKLETVEKKYILYHRKNGTTVLKEYPEMIMRHCNIQKDQQTCSINTQYQYSISNSTDSNCNFVLQASVESVINTSRILRQPQCKVIKSL